MQALALTLTLVVHVLGACALVWAMLDSDDRAKGMRGWWPRDDPRGDPPPEPGPAPSGDRAPLPLPGAAPSPVRLREPARAGDAYPRRRRRPEHAPADPARQPTRGRSR